MARVAKWEYDEFSESLKSFRVSTNGFFSSPVVVDIATVASHLNREEWLWVSAGLSQMRFASVEKIGGGIFIYFILIFYKNLSIYIFI